MVHTTQGLRELLGAGDGKHSFFKVDFLPLNLLVIVCQKDRLHTEKDQFESPSHAILFF